MSDSQATVFETKRQIGLGRRILNSTAGPASIVIWVALCFAGAGRLDWVRGWICVSVYLSAMAVTGALVCYFSPGLIGRRSQWVRENTAPFDRLFLPFFVPLTFILPFVAGLDAGRYRWLPLPDWTMMPGIVLFVTGIGLITWTMIVNPFAETSVRIQPELGHRVIGKGPYKSVRHPMYAGSILMYPATALVLGSGWAIVVAAALAVVIVFRTAKEDRFLHCELRGYQEYAAHTRFRLFPGLW